MCSWINYISCRRQVAGETHSSNLRGRPSGRPLPIVVPSLTPALKKGAIFEATFYGIPKEPLAPDARVAGHWHVATVRAHSTCEHQPASTTDGQVAHSRR